MRQDSVKEFLPKALIKLFQLQNKSIKIMDKTIFLDRDGVINIDSPQYIKKESEFEFIPGSPQAIALLNQYGFNVIVITNQSMIGRNMVSREALDAIFKKMKKGVQKAGGRIKDVFFCPHTPEDNCACRKPEPGLIFKACKKYSIDLEYSSMVGDSAKDIECALNAGCERGILVQTGNGIKAQQQLLQKQITPDYIASDLYDAVQWLVS
jgi:D-glycero-D-manno-heptose 1,7-bisphosphate phosphatase